MEPLQQTPLRVPREAVDAFDQAEALLGQIAMAPVEASGLRIAVVTLKQCASRLHLPAAAAELGVACSSPPRRWAVSEQTQSAVQALRLARCVDVHCRSLLRAREPGSALPPVDDDTGRSSVVRSSAFSSFQVLLSLSLRP